MKVFKCDRCGAIFEYEPKEAQTACVISLEENMSDWDEWGEYDLCENCMTELKEWLKNG